MRFVVPAVKQASTAPTAVFVKQSLERRSETRAASCAVVANVEINFGRSELNFCRPGTPVAPVHRNEKKVQ